MILLQLMTDSADSADFVQPYHVWMSLFMYLLHNVINIHFQW